MSGDRPKRPTDAGRERVRQTLRVVQPPPVADAANWRHALERGRSGRLKGNLNNLVLILEHDAELTIGGPNACPLVTGRALVERNEFTSELVTRSRDRVNGDLWTDQHDPMLRYLIEKKYEVSVSARNLQDAIVVYAEKHKFHPVREYLKSLVWDGKARVEHLFIDYLGAPDDEYHREAARLTCLGAVTRVMEPGHKFDFVPIIEGAQGRRKSTFIMCLAKNWFAMLDGDFGNRKAMVEKMQGAWILELPELSALSRSDSQIVKEFISSSTDKERLAYGRRAVVFRRQSIMIGSTNEAEYLRDLTGNRRFWPIKCRVDQIDTDKLLLAVDEIWAEAVVIYAEARRAQPSGVLDLSLHSAQAQEIALTFQVARRQESVVDVWAGMLEEWLTSTGRVETCTSEAWKEGLRYEGRPTVSDLRNLNAALRAVPGWSVAEDGRQRRFGTYGKQRVFVRENTGGEK